MPVDQKRVNGPEVSIPYSIYIDSNVKHIETKKSITNRPDGRKPSELRKMFVKTNIVSRAKGSAYIEMGRTKVVCSVFNPREIPNKNDYSNQGELFCEFKYASFSSCKRKIHQQDAEEKEFSLIMQRALEPAVCRHEFPNFQVDVYVLVLENGGSSLGAGIMAASLALADASVPMFGLVATVTMGVYKDVFLMDPTDDEERLCSTELSASNDSQNWGIIMQATLPQHGQISEFFFSGNISSKSIKTAVQSLTTASKDICPVIQQCLVKSVVKSLKRKANVTMEKKKL